MQRKYTSSEIDIMIVSYLNGNKKIINEILKGLEPKIEYFVSRYCYNYGYRSDFRNEGVLAVYEALSKWDPNREILFTTFVNDYLKKYMINYLHEYASNTISKLNHNVKLDEMSQSRFTEFNIDLSNSSINDVENILYYRSFQQYLHNEINKYFSPSKTNQFKNCRVKKIMKLKYLSHIDYVSKDIATKLNCTKSYVDLMLKEYKNVIIKFLIKWETR